MKIREALKEKLNEVAFRLVARAFAFTLGLLDGYVGTETVDEVIASYRRGYEIPPDELFN